MNLCEIGLFHIVWDVSKGTCDNYHEIWWKNVLGPKYIPAHGRVGRVTDCWVRGLWFNSSGLILTSRTKTSSLSPVVRYGWDPYSVPVSEQGGGGGTWFTKIFHLLFIKTQKVLEHDIYWNLILHHFDLQFFFLKWIIKIL